MKDNIIFSVTAATIVAAVTIGPWLYEVVAVGVIILAFFLSLVAFGGIGSYGDVGKVASLAFVLFIGLAFNGLMSCSLAPHALQRQEEEMAEILKERNILHKRGCNIIGYSDTRRSRAQLWTCPDSPDVVRSRYIHSAR